MTPLLLLIAGVSCSPYDQATAHLGGKYHEFSVARGLGGDGIAFELWSASDGKTWSLLSVTPDGMACLVKSGVSLEWSAPLPGEPA